MEIRVVMEQLCPYCKGRLEPGMVEAWSNGRTSIRWRSWWQTGFWEAERLTKSPILVPAKLPGYICRTCRTVIGRY